MATESDHHDLSTNHELKLPKDGQGRVVLNDDTVHDWGDDFNYNFEQMDQKVTVRGTNAERTAIASPDSDMFFFETDTESMFWYDGASWNEVFAASDADTLDGYDSTEFAVLAENETITGEWAFSSKVDIENNVEFQFGTSENIGLAWNTTSGKFEIDADPQGLGAGRTVMMDFDETTYAVDVPNGTLSEGGNPVLTTADEGSGNGIDADTVDGYEGSELGVLAEAETVTGAWNFTGGLQESGAAVLTTADEGAGNGLDADTLDGAQGAAYAKLGDNETVTGNWDHTGDLEHDGEDVMAVKSSPNLHLPMTELEASGGNDTATTSVWVDAGETFTLWGWGIIETDGTVPTDTSLKVLSGDLTGSPTNEYEEDPPTTWNEGAAGSSLATVSGGTSGVAVHIQMVNDKASAYTASLSASYTIE